MRPRLTYANVMATLAVFIALGGTAYAVNTIGSSDVIDESLLSQDIKNGEVKVADIGQGAVATDEIANDGIKAGDIGDGEVRNPDIATAAVKTDELANGQVLAEDLAPGVAPGASGARAWALVDSSGTLLRSKQVTSVSHTPDSSVYCIDPAPSINADTAVLVAGQATGINTGNDSSLELTWIPSAVGCPAQTMEVVTVVGFGDPPTGGELDQGGFDLEPAQGTFTIVIP